MTEFSSTVLWADGFPKHPDEFLRDSQSLLPCVHRQLVHCRVFSHQWPQSLLRALPCFGVCPASLIEDHINNVETMIVFVRTLVLAWDVTTALGHMTAKLSGNVLAADMFSNQPAIVQFFNLWNVQYFYFIADFVWRSLKDLITRVRSSPPLRLCPKLWHVALPLHDRGGPRHRSAGRG